MDLNSSRPITRNSKLKGIRSNLTFQYLGQDFMNERRDYGWGSMGKLRSSKLVSHKTTKIHVLYWFTYRFGCLKKVSKTPWYDFKVFWRFVFDIDIFANSLSHQQQWILIAESNTPDSEKRNFTVDDDPSNWGIRIKRNQSMCLINEYDKRLYYCYIMPKKGQYKNSHKTKL